MPAQNERRSDPRYAYPSRIDYVHEAYGPELLKGVTINISKSGLSMYAFVDLPEGENIVIRSSLPVDVRNAVICWVKQEQGGMFQMGLKFTNTVDRSRNRSGHA